MGLSDVLSLSVSDAVGYAFRRKPGSPPASPRVASAAAFADRHRKKAYLVGAALVLLAVAWSLSARHSAIGTGTVPYGMTHGSGYDFSRSIDSRPVGFKPMLTEGRDWLADAIGWTFYGSYDSWTGRMDYNDKFSSPEAAAGLERTVLHEYGHVLLDDTARRAGGGGLAGNAYGWWVSTSARLAGRRVGRAFVWTYPKPLRMAYASYVANRDVYSPEFTNSEANLGEYFAESYARTIDGRGTPGDMVPVMESLSSRTTESAPASRNAGSLAGGA